MIGLRFLLYDYILNLKKYGISSGQSIKISPFLPCEIFLLASLPSFSESFVFMRNIPLQMTEDFFNGLDIVPLDADYSILR